MIEILTFLKTGVGVVLLFGAAIFVHEFGHYWVARRIGMKVEAFAIGFGPKIFGWTRDGIEYSVRWIPAGGFVKLPQMITSSALEGEAGKEPTPPAPPWSKILVAVAGPTMNVVFAFAIATLIYYVGLPVQVNPSVIGYVEPGSPEAKLGIQDGDTIVAVDGKPVNSWEEVYKITVTALTNVLPVAIEHERKTNIYELKAQSTGGPIEVKTLNLSPRDLLIAKEVKEGSAAEKAHMQVGDEIVNFAGVRISAFSQLTNLLQKCAGQATPMVVKRGDAPPITLMVTPATEVTAEKGRLGVMFGLGKDVYVLQHPTPWAQIADDLEQEEDTISALVHSHSSGVKASDMSGPVGIISILAVKVNTDYRLALSFLVFLNIGLAIVNMLPIPVLDGGHIMMSILESIRRRPLDVRLVEYTTTVFAVLLISFMLYVTFFDVKRLPLIRMLFNQESQIEQSAAPAAAPAPSDSSGQPMNIQNSRGDKPAQPRQIKASKTMRYCQSPFLYSRRKTREVVVGDPAAGGVIIGGDHPVVKQSMLTCDTMDTAECVKQTLELVAAGCQIVRITAPTVKDAGNLKIIVAELRERGCRVPIVADIHFKPDAAMEAARWVEMVRVNPGNYADKKKFAVREYSDDQYTAELARIEEQFAPLVKLCQQLGRALRIGTNHGSLSDRIMNRYGDTPLGMVESALEFARIARAHDYHNFKFSMKSSNPKVMIECYRLLVARLEELGPDWNYPIHLGVTEAGEGEDGRIKSAIGIGSLLCDGLGDTIRVSLTEDSPHEIAVCTDLLALIPTLTMQEGAESTAVKSAIRNLPPAIDPFSFTRRPTPEIELTESVKCGGEQTVRVVVTRATWDKVAPRIRPRDDVRPEAVYEDLNLQEIDPTAEFSINCDTQLVTVKDDLGIPAIAAFRLLAARLKRLGRNNPILLKDCLEMDATPVEPKIALLRASVVIGSLLADGVGDAILIRGEPGAGQSLRLAYNILQAAGCRSFKTDYVACPSCGRTLFNLQTVTARIKTRTAHLKGVKIAIMGCIVNGPGEMADADFGYVGGAPNKINLYVGKTPVKFNIPEVEAVDRLVDLIREHGKWMEPENETAVVVQH